MDSAAGGRFRETTELANRFAFFCFAVANAAAGLSVQGSEVKAMNRFVTRTPALALACASVLWAGAGPARLSAQQNNDDWCSQD